jgi:predicted outer membrane repeat protein
MFSRSFRIVCVTVVLGAFALFTSARVVLAANQVVNNCSNDDELRNDLAAMQSSGGGLLTFNCGTAKITLDAGSQLPIITTNTTVEGGSNITLHANGSRLFVVNASGTLNFQHIVLEAGYNNGDGGAIYNTGSLSLNGATIRNSIASSNGGAIWTNRPVNILNSVMHDNRSSDGGALYSSAPNATITITNSAFHHNKANAGAPPNGLGGALFVEGPLNITGSEFSNNEAGAGGALYVNTASANVHIVNALFHDNASRTTDNSAGGGGAIFADDHATVSITSSSIYNNTMKSKGGGILNSATLILSNVSLGQNSGQGTGYGGGIYNDGTLTLSNVTVNGNSAYWGGGIANRLGGTMNLTNVTVSKNSAGSIGGGIYAVKSFMNLTNVTLSGNSAGSGGGLYNSQGTANLPMSHSATTW